MSLRKPLRRRVPSQRRPVRNLRSRWWTRRPNPARWSPAVRHGFQSAGKPTRHSKSPSRPRDSDLKLLPGLRRRSKRPQPLRQCQPRRFPHRLSSQRLRHLLRQSPSAPCRLRPRRRLRRSRIGRKRRLLRLLRLLNPLRRFFPNQRLRCSHRPLRHRRHPHQHRHLPPKSRRWLRSHSAIPRPIRRSPSGSWNYGPFSVWTGK